MRIAGVSLLHEVVRGVLTGEKVPDTLQSSGQRWLRTFKEPEGQLARWQEMLTNFDFEVVYRPGEKHSNADALQRIPMRELHACAKCTAVGVNALSRQSSQSNWAQAQHKIRRHPLCTTGSYMGNANRALKR